MSKVNHILVIAEGKDNIVSLVSGARTLGEKVTLVFTGEPEDALGADKAYCVTGKSFTIGLKVIADLVGELQPELVITDCGKNGRLIAGVLAGRFGAGLLSDVSELTIEGERVTASRMVYGGLALKTESVVLPLAVACMAAGAFEETELSACSDVSVLECVETGIRFVEKQPVTVAKVNLSSAKKLVSAGRGVANEEVLKQVFEIAEHMGAEVGCSRPVAEELHWLPKERYIGVSGAMVKPDIYVCFGISGQIQHMVGANGAKQIFAINKDKNAPIFNQCDYGLVADINQFIPLLKERI